MVKCSQTNLKGGHLINQFINSSFMMLYVFIEKEGLTERAILLCKLNKSLLESSISVGIHRQKSLYYLIVFVSNKPVGPKVVKKLFVYYVIS